MKNVNKIREYKNRYWLVNDDVYELHFHQFYDDEIILKFIQNKEDSENYIYVSGLLNVEHDEEFAESIEDAMEQFEYMVIDYIKEKIGYYYVTKQGLKLLLVLVGEGLKITHPKYIMFS